MPKPSLTALGATAAAIGLLAAPSSAWSIEYYLSQDLGIQGLSHLCEYTNGQVYSFSATQLCPLHISDDGPPSVAPAGAAPGDEGDGDVSLFDSTGKPVAYIDTGDDMTVYLWDGQPVAYLDADGSDAYNVYGFNGQHLGWFSNGAIWDHSGYAACAVQQRLTVAAQIAPIKGIQQITPIRSVQQIEPVEPVLMNAFGDAQCESLLASGAN